MVVIVVLAKVPVNCSREGVILQMALVVINATKEPAAFFGFYLPYGLAWLPRTGTLSKFFHQIVVGNLGEQ